MLLRDKLWRATVVERDHQNLFHSLIVGAAFLTYLIDRDDVLTRMLPLLPGRRTAR